MKWNHSCQSINMKQRQAQWQCWYKIHHFIISSRSSHTDSDVNDYLQSHKTILFFHGLSLHPLARYYCFPKEQPTNKHRSAPYNYIYEFFFLFAFVLHKPCMAVVMMMMYVSITRALAMFFSESVCNDFSAQYLVRGKLSTRHRRDFCSRRRVKRRLNERPVMTSG